jgi:hypothetical protein
MPLICVSYMIDFIAVLYTKFYVGHTESHVLKLQFAVNLP